MIIMMWLFQEDLMERVPETKLRPRDYYQLKFVKTPLRL